jgi:hypothetical protein
MQSNKGKITLKTSTLAITIIAFIFNTFFALGIDDENHFQKKLDDIKEQMKELEYLGFEGEEFTFIIPQQVFAGKEDKDNNDKEEEQASTTGTYCNGVKYYGITDCSNLEEIKKQQQQKEEEFIDEKRKWIDRWLI